MSPDKSREFVNWALSHVESINAFVATHPGWNEFVFADNKHVAAANAFLNWARKYSQAARELVSRPGAVQTNC